MAISPDGKTLAAANYDGNVKLWNLAAANSEEIRSPFPHGERLDWDNRLVYSKRGQLLAAAYTQRAIVIRDLAKSKETVRIALEDAGVAYLTFSNDDTEIVALLLGSKVDNTSERNNSAARWDAMTGTRRSTTRLGPQVGFKALSPDGRYAVADFRPMREEASGEGIYVIELQTGVKLFQVGGENLDDSWLTLVGSYVFSSDGSWLVTCNQQGILIRELPSGKRLKHIKAQPIVATIGASLSSDKKRLAFVSGSVAEVYNLESGKPLGVVNAGDSADCTAAVLSPDGRILATQRSPVNWKDEPVGSLLKVWRLPDDW